MIFPNLLLYCLLRSYVLKRYFSAHTFANKIWTAPRRRFCPSMVVDFEVLLMSSQGVLIYLKFAEKPRGISPVPDSPKGTIGTGLGPCASAGPAGPHFAMVKY